MKNSKHVPVALFFLLASLGLLTQNRLSDPDYFWHLKVGEYIWATRSVPKTNVFGYFDQLKFFSHEWLFDAVLFQFKNQLGDWGVYLFLGLNISIFLFLLYKILMVRTKRPFFSLALSGFTTILMIVPFFQPRPQIVSYNILLTLLLILHTSFDRLTSKFFSLAILIVLIVNQHAGFYPLLFLVMGIYTFGAFAEKLWKSHSFQRALRSITRPMVVIMGLLPFVVINPYGVEIYTYPFRVMMDEGTYHILEWKPLFQSGVNPVFLTVILLVFAVLILSKNRIKVSDFIFVMLFFTLALNSARHFALFVIFASIAIALPLSDFVRYAKEKLFAFLSRSEDRRRKFLVVVLCLDVLLVGTVVYMMVSDRPLFADQEVSASASRYPDDAMAYMEDNALDLENRRLFNSYDWGGYLIYHDFKVFIDGRADVYLKTINKDSRVFDDYIAITTVKDGWEGLLDKYEVVFILYHPKSTLTKLLRVNDDWQVIYEDKTAILFERKE